MDTNGELADPAWRLTALVLPVGAALSAVLALVQTLTGSLDPAYGYGGSVVLALLCLGLARDAYRRQAAGNWVRTEVHEFALSLALLLTALALAAHGADIVVYAPILATLLPLLWTMTQSPPVRRMIRLLPMALPVLNPGQMAGPELIDEVRDIVREVIDRLPSDIAAQLDGWTIDVQDEPADQQPGMVVYGRCYYAGRVIAIYRGPHLRDSRRGADLRQAVTYTVLHEIAHALGLDEHGVRRLGWLAEPAEADATSPDT
jgi:predicted Zn-dependent protease with MMP-like domain